jgi:S1 RNA binding domain protein
MTIEIGSTIEGTVVKVADYGAIIRLAGGKMGLVHISEVADTFVRDVRDYVKENDRINVKVLKVNNKGRYELSAKQAEAIAVEVRERAPAPPQQKPQPEPYREFYTEHVERQPVTFEDKLSRFMKDSQERLLDVKRNVDSKRGVKRR